jgi:alkylation response protein AidB-like acyl-CoA dehydrogenase
MESQGISMFVPTLLQYGNDEQKRKWIAPTIRGDLVWCQGYSEPGAGSDLASLRTSAVLQGDEFVVNGQKIWTSTARESHMMFALVRTEPDAPKHAGISYLVVDMKSAGIDVRPLKTMIGTASFNEVFFEDVRVPKENLVGKRGQGWEVGTNTLFHERNMLGRSNQTETMLRNCIDVLRETGAIDDPVFRQRAMEIDARVQAMKFHGLRLLTDRLKGRSSGVAGLVTKLNGCQLNHEICLLAIDAMRERGLLKHGSRHVRDEGHWQGQYMFTLGLIIGGGTAQIQKNIIAERGLGMPREPKPAA